MQVLDVKGEELKDLAFPDENVKRANEKDGWTLCGRCDGTGNELYAMYRACSECGGAGHVGDAPWRVRFRRWRGEQRTRREFRRPLADRIRGRATWLLSYCFGVGHYFWDRHDDCSRCGALPSDIEFQMRRVGPFRAECADRGMCDEMKAETDRFNSTRISDNPQIGEQEK